MGAVVSRERLAAVLGMMGSDHDGEVLAAARMAERMRRDAGLTWHDLIAPVPPATSPHTAPEPMGWRYALAVCRVHQDRLTPWERSFVDQLAGYRRRPSDKQLQILSGIYCKAAA